MEIKSIQMAAFIADENIESSGYNHEKVERNLERTRRRKHLIVVSTSAEEQKVFKKMSALEIRTFFASRLCA